MNSVLCRTTDETSNECLFEFDRKNMDVAQYEYATAPMATVHPATLAEEELHELFESAISDRLLAMREQMARISGPLPYTRVRNYETEALPVVVAKQPEKLLTFLQHWQRPVLYGSLGLMLTLVGFDLMGLLVLCTR